MAQDYNALIEGAAKQYNVDPALIRGVIGVESQGNPAALSEKGAQGLGQLMPATAKGLGVTNPNDPQQNIYGTAKYLDQLLTRSKGDVKQALTWYHGGFDPANYGPRTAAYPGKVLSNLQGSRNMKLLPGIPDTTAAYTADGSSTDDVFNSFVKGDTPAAASATTQNPPADDIDATFNKFVKGGATPTTQPAAPAPAQAPAVSGPDRESQFPSLGLPQGVNDFIDAAGHHVGNSVLGAVQLVANAVGQGEDINKYVQQREANYQAAVPDNAASFAGAAVGEILPFLGTGGVSVVRGAAMAGRSLAARLGASELGQWAASKVGTVAGNAGLGALAGAVAPVTDGGQNFDQSKLNQVAIGAGIGGAAAPVVGALGAGVGYAGNVIGSLVRPFTEKGQQQIANSVLRRAAEGGPTAVNAAELVPGSAPTLAEATANPGVSTLQRVIADRNPNEFSAVSAQNNTARQEAMQNLIGTPADIESAAAARALSANQQITQVFTGAQPVNSQPIVDTIDGILNGPSGKRDAVKQVLNNIRSKLVNGPDITTTTPPSRILDANGNPIVVGGSSIKPNLETDPETIYNSVRKQIGDLLDTKMATSNPSGLQASRELLQVRDALDAELSKAAPGFDNYLQSYAQASQPINAMQYLQGLGLTDSKGNLTLQKVQTAINNIGKLQQAAGTNNAKSVTADQLTALKGLRDDLLRQTNTSLGRSAGSNTYQNFATNQLLSAAVPGKLGDLVGGVSAAGVGAGLGSLAAGVPGAVVGANLGGGVSKLGQALLKHQNAAIENKLSNMLLNPKVAGQKLGEQGLSLAAPASGPSLTQQAYPTLTGALVGGSNSRAERR